MSDSSVQTSRRHRLAALVTGAAVVLGGVVVSLPPASAAAAPGSFASSFEGSTDGSTFTTIATRTGQTWTGRGVRNTYGVATPAGYAYYRLVISAPQSGGLLQLADWDLAQADDGTSQQPMVTATGNGPS